MLAKVLKITIGGFLIGVIVSAVDLIYQLIQGSFYVSGFMSSMNFFGANTIVNWVFGCIVITVAVVITSFISLLRKREDRGYYKGIVIGCVVAFAMLMVITSAVPVNIVIHGFMNPKSLVFNGILSILGVGFIIFGLSIAGRLSRFFGLRPVKYIAIAISVISLIATVIGMSFYRDYEKLPLRESKTGPNVIIISFDALRRDYLSCYDDSKVNTPNLDKFAARSTLFENSFCNAPSTIPSMMTMNTGHYPSVHNAGLYHSAPRNMITLAQVLGSYDYRTEAYVGNNILYGEYGFSRGYNSYVEYGDLGEFLPFQRATLYRFISKFRSTVSKYFGIEKDITEWCTDVLIGAVERNHGKPRPYFLWVHYLDPHVPLTPPRKYIRGEDEFVDEALRFGVLKSSNGRLLTPDDSEYIVELYSGEVAYLDDMFGRVLTVFDDYGVWDDTMIIVTADHGEDHFDHGNYGHGYAHYRGILAVPLLVYLPDKTGGNRIHELASLIDVPATIFDYIGAEEPTFLYGKSLLPYINGDGGGSLNYVFAEKTVPGSSVKSVRDGDYCLIRKGNSEYEYELYDMKSDPFEQDDISDEMETERERLAAIMEEWELDMKGIAAEIGDGSSVELDADRTDKLKGLGYLE